MEQTNLTQNKTELTTIENQIPTELESVDSLSINKLTEPDKKIVLEIIKSINLDQTESIINFGTTPQNKIAAFCEQILETVKPKDVDSQVAEALTNLGVEIRNFEVSPEERKGILSSLFGGINKGIKKTDEFGKQLKNELNLTKKEIDKLQIKFETVSNTIESIVTTLESCKIKLIKNVTVMDQMYDTNLEYYKELSLYVIAGKERLNSYEDEIKIQEDRAVKSNDQMEIQKLNEMLEMKNKFEKKIDDLLRSRLISIQNAPQIRLVQRGSEQLVYQIQNSILTAIPIWKSQMVIALGIANNRNALGLQKHINDATNDILRKNSELLKQGTLEIAAESEKGLVSVETLQITNNNLIETINGVMEIQKKGKEDRKIAEVEIIRLENELKKTLLGNK